MKKLKNDITNSPEYIRFIRENREILSGINIRVIGLLDKMNKINTEYIDTTDELLKLSEISTTIHQQYSSSTGEDEVFKIKSIFNKFKKNSMSDSINIETARFLANKINSHIENSFTELEISQSETTEPGAALPETQPMNRNNTMSYKWFTFSRNGSWFIIPYHHVKIINAAESGISETGSKRYISVDGADHEVIDLMNMPVSHKREPAYLLQFDSKKYVYASDHNGKEILANSDIVTPIIKPIKDRKISYRGRVRLFGINYLVPESTDPES